MQKIVRTMFYQTILDSDENGETIQSLLCSCPNCGVVSPVSVLQETGCPYCKTRFLISELYPRVCNYFFINCFPMVPDLIRSELKSLLPKAVVISAILTVIRIWSSLFTKNLYGIITGIACFPFFIPAGLLIAFVFLLVRIVWNFGKQSAGVFRMFSGSLHSRERFDEKCRQWDPSFNYLYFGEKLCLWLMPFCFMINCLILYSMKDRIFHGNLQIL